MKPRTAKDKGRWTENAAVAYLRSWGLVHAERRRLKGAADEGDITGWPGVVVEVKSGARLDIAGWLHELDAEMFNAHAISGFVMVRPKGKPDPADWFALLPMPLIMALYEAAGWLPETRQWLHRIFVVGYSGTRENSRRPPHSPCSVGCRSSYWRSISAQNSGVAGIGSLSKPSNSNCSSRRLRRSDSARKRDNS
jgi:hypothetical protein